MPLHFDLFFNTNLSPITPQGYCIPNTAVIKDLTASQR